MINRKIFRAVAFLMALAVALTCFAGCKSSGGDSVSGVLDTNGIAGSEIEIDLSDDNAGDGKPSKQENNKPVKGEQQQTETPDQETETPDAETPDTETPDPETPDTETPDTETPDVEQEPEQETQKPAQKPEQELPQPEVNKPVNGGNSSNNDIIHEEGEIDEPEEDENEGEEEDEDVVDSGNGSGKPAYNAAKKLKIVSYNIKHCGSNSENMEKLAAQLKEVNGDIVGLQEVDHRASRSGGKDQTAELAKLAGYKYYYFEPVISLDNTKKPYPENATNNLYGHAVLSKYPIVKSEIIWPEAQSKTGEPRNFGRHEINVNGKIVVFYNTHADFEKGRYQYEEIQRDYMSKDKYAICVGDFNETYSEFSRYFDFDQFYCFAFGNDPSGANQVYRDKSGKKAEVIDHIIVTKEMFVWKDDSAKNGYHVKAHDGATDHDMIYCYLNLL